MARLFPEGEEDVVRPSECGREAMTPHNKEKIQNVTAVDREGRRSG
jgi:hypothetical protein